MIPTDITLSADQFLLVTLLVKVGVMASLATMLVRYRFFKRILLVGERGRREDWQFAALFGSLIAVGVALRIILGYSAADLSLAGILLIGLLTGPMIGAVTGCLIGIIAAMHGEVFAVPMGALYGITGGLVSKTCPTRDAVWNFSPLTFMSVYRFFKHVLVSIRPDWKVILIVSCVALEALNIGLVQRFGRGQLFSPTPASSFVLLCMFISTIACVGIPLKIWNSTRIEILLEKQEALVARARFDALKSQINPHFLFNTLNSISVAVRTDPMKARHIIIKLSNILRRLLKTGEDFVLLREELAFIDAYLDIELVRFGPEKLRIERHIDERTLDVLIPSMVLQPIVENAVKHGIEPKITGGTVRITSQRQDGRVIIDVEDDGEGVAAERLSTVLTTGIGLSNVNERLQVVFGQQYHLQFDSQPHHGTRVRIEIPDRAPHHFVGTHSRAPLQA